MNRIELVPGIKTLPLNQGGRRYLATTLVIDGCTVGEHFFLDWKELFRTLRGPGEFFFWTGIDGEPLSANIHDPTFVAREPDGTITWTLFDPISLDELKGDEMPCERLVRFHADEYEHALHAGRWRACKIARAHPDIYVYPVGYSAATLLDLPNWLKTDDAKPFEPIYTPYRNEARS